MKSIVTAYPSGTVIVMLPLWAPLKFQWFSASVAPAVIVMCTVLLAWSTWNQSGIVISPEGAAAAVSAAGAGAEAAGWLAAWSCAGSPPPQAARAATRESVIKRFIEVCPVLVAGYRGHGRAKPPPARRPVSSPLETASRAGHSLVR